MCFHSIHNDNIISTAKRIMIPNESTTRETTITTTTTSSKTPKTGIETEKIKEKEPGIDLHGSTSKVTKNESVENDILKTWTNSWTNRNGNTNPQTDKNSPKILIHKFKKFFKS